jgi:serine/threonine-protein kinase
MKLAERGSLSDRLPEHALPTAHALTADERKLVQRSQQRIARFMAEIARAVHYLHDQGIIHRDLKPRNILLDARGKPLVSDFGLAREFRGVVDEREINGSHVSEHEEEGATGTRKDTVLGTPGYMSPEQAQGRNDLTKAVDIWGLGAILYELLTGRRTFDGEKDQVIKQTAEMDRPVLAPSRYNPNVERDSDLELICMKCLKKREARYASASALADDLEQYARGGETSVRRQSWLERISRSVVGAINHKLSLPGVARWGMIDLWDAGLNLAVHGAVFALIRNDQPPALLWFAVLAFYVLWWWMFLTYLFRHDPIDPLERHLALLWSGVFLAGMTLLWIYCPPIASAKARDLLAFYPPWAVVNGVAFLIVGRLYWGVYYIIGLAHFLVAALMPLRLDLAPLIYAVFVAICMSLAALDHIRTARRENTLS